jgi:hypothetical protein
VCSCLAVFSVALSCPPVADLTGAASNNMNLPVGSGLFASIAAFSGAGGVSVDFVLRDPSRWAGATHPVTENVVFWSVDGVCADNEAAARTIQSVIVRVM